ncbi:Signal peptidase I [Methanosarcina horonobensis HB-1 = JCM 15518]|uniref:Signal peptidase I n=1 Tax=Methanosarcina horonobensis HB-1 = JCM 15518 TaxID=1434110 RepID=A0A0E3WTS1_9EURY|nr:signal peptidase I [Methanosarcina horonobensis]AKB78370.1 Signal peptidase I [Methanosarcina horonobensis HB-1 = JCM 15518]
MKKRVIQIAIIFLVAIFLASALIPFVLGSEKTLVVLSGSMTPVMLPGDIIVVKSVTPDGLMAGDIIAFQDPGGKDTFVTHRIIGIEEGEERIFRTKGDANEEEDIFKVPASEVVGKLVFVIPFAGYLPETSKNKIFFFFTVIIPATVIVLDEIKTIIRYSNPISARKAENKKEKISRRISFTIRGKRLATVVLVSGFIFTGTILSNLGENGPAVLQKENTVESSYFLPSVCVLLPEDSKNRFAIEPWYAVIPPYSEILVNAPENMRVKISSAPYILPVFWVISLAEINPYLPVVAEIVFYTSIFTLSIFPLWYRKIELGRKVKRGRFNRLFFLWKRKLNLV